MRTDSKALEPPRKKQLRAAEPIRASQLEVRPVEWLWPGRVPLGGVTVLAGEPGLGKSLLSVWLTARLSRGDLGKPGTSLLLTAEDSRERTVLPRLVAAGGRARAGRLPAGGSRWAGKDSLDSR